MKKEKIQKEIERLKIERMRQEKKLNMVYSYQTQIENLSSMSIK